MTAATASLRRSMPAIRVPLRPEEGWTTTLLLVAMPVVLALAIDDANWVLGEGRLTDFLPLAAIGGFAAGMYGAKAGWSRWSIHLVGAVFAALIVPLLVGGALLGSVADTSFHARYVATATATLEAWLDLAVRGRTFTSQYGHFLLTLGLLLWATGQFVAVAAFRHRRPLAGVGAVGIALVVNLVVNPNDQLWFLVGFTVLALLVLVRFHALAEHGDWIRRRIGDPGPVEAMVVRGGAGFVTAAVVAALLLTGSASSAPLAGAWGGVDQWLIEAGRGLQRYFSFVQNVRGPVSVDFGPTAPIGRTWITNGEVAVTIQLPAGDETKYYWQAVTYDRFDGSGWSWSDEASADRAADQGVLDGTLDAPVDDGRRVITAAVSPGGYHGSRVLAPGTPVAVSQQTRLTTIGPDGFFAGLDTRPGDVGYEVQALVPVLGDGDPKGLTQNRLRAAGTDYPADVAATYLSFPKTAVGPDAQALLDRVKAGLGDHDSPYDLAKALVDEFHSSRFTYSADISNIDCGALGVVECFAHYRTGYCQYYATTMAILLRSEGIPSRIVQGFLPGERDSAGVETLRNSNSHAWVQVYFPGYGWVDFDPTGGNLAQIPQIPLGSPVPSASPKPSASSGGDIRDPRRSLSLPPDALPGTTTGGGTDTPSPAAFAVVAILLVTAFGILAAVAYRRGPRQVTGDTAYGALVRLAGRFGFGPRPTQTVYEYASSLGDVLPFARPELQTVANAKVEVAYARAELAPERVRALRDAVGRLRLALLRLAFRRSERKAFRRSSGPRS
ncbi:MAG TPA: transglutaminase domain-containing protein [Candidatus Limnocylindrales bacterium]|nr:transglutaminase domain-containing protein [Candidatus Limnocylindrales bacterium]